MRIDGLIRMLIFRYGFRFLKKGADSLARPRDAEGNKIAKKDMTPEQREKLKRTSQNTSRAAKMARLVNRVRRF